MMIHNMPSYLTQDEDTTTVNDSQETDQVELLYWLDRGEGSKAQDSESPDDTSDVPDLVNREEDDNIDSECDP